MGGTRTSMGASTSPGRATLTTSPGSPAARGSIKRQRSRASIRARELGRSLENPTLEVELLRPAKLEVYSQPTATPPEPLQGQYARAARQVQAAGGGPAAGRWTLEMLGALMSRLVERASSDGSLSSSGALAVLLAGRNATYSFESDLVPAAWVQRSEAVYCTLCDSLVTPSWGTKAVDATNLALAIGLSGQRLGWPSLQMLEATRRQIEAKAGASYPDSKIDEAAFLKLPLWEEMTEAPKRWVFRALLCFEDEAKPRTPEDGAASSAGVITTRRLFAYLGLGDTPSEGFRNAYRLLLCPAPTVSEAEADTEEQTQTPPASLRVQDLWTVLFSQRGRPSGAVAAAPELAEFCKELLPAIYGDEVPVEVDVPAAKGKAKAKAAAVPEPSAEDKEPPPPPEEAVVTLSESELLGHPAVLRGLCTHGALFCRPRILASLFPEGGSAPELVPSAVAAAPKGLAPLMPPPPAEGEGAEGGGQ